MHQENYGVYGVRKMHAALRRAQVPIGRDQTARLMRQLGVAGVRRGRFKRTTTPDPGASRPADLVNREFRAQRPDQLWVCDMTYIRTAANAGDESRLMAQFVQVLTTEGPANPSPGTPSDRSRTASTKPRHS